MLYLIYQVFFLSNPKVYVNNLLRNNYTYSLYSGYSARVKKDNKKVYEKGDLYYETNTGQWISLENIKTALSIDSDNIEKIEISLLDKYRDIH